MERRVRFRPCRRVTLSAREGHCSLRQGFQPAKEERFRSAPRPIAPTAAAKGARAAWTNRLATGVSTSGRGRPEIATVQRSKHPILLADQARWSLLARAPITAVGVRLGVRSSARGTGLSCARELMLERRTSVLGPPAPVRPICPSACGRWHGNPGRRACTHQGFVIRSFDRVVRPLSSTGADHTLRPPFVEADCQRIGKRVLCSRPCGARLHLARDAPSLVRTPAASSNSATAPPVDLFETSGRRRRFAEQETCRVLLELAQCVIQVPGRQPQIGEGVVQ